MKTICFMSNSKLRRAVALILLLPLSAIYLNDTLIILIFSWGESAYLMTQYSFDFKVGFINTNTFCLYDLFNIESIDQLKKIFAKSLEVNRFSPLILTVPLSLALFLLQYQTKKTEKDQRVTERA